MFEWMITPWTECSQTCGSSIGFKVGETTSDKLSIYTIDSDKFTVVAFQNRKAQCMVRLNNATQNVDNALCQDAGLSVPETVERCGQVECPQWHTSAWTKCKESRCISRNKAVQRRTVTCRRPPVTKSFLRNIVTAKNQEEEEEEENEENEEQNENIGYGVADWSEQLTDEQCAEDERPVPRLECHNSRCMAVWNVEPWSEVSLAVNKLEMFYNENLKYNDVVPCHYPSKRLLLLCSQCNASCGGQGVKYRILQCVWHGTTRPAGNGCKDLPRPAVMKVCKGHRCASNCK